MNTIEQHFLDVEKAAVQAERAAATLSAAAKYLQKAARAGDLVDLKRSLQRVFSALDTVRAADDVARTAWPLSDADEETLLQEHYSSTLVQQFQERGIRAFEHKGDIMAFPFVLRVLPKERALRINGKKTNVLRPSALEEILERARKPKYSNEKLLEIFYNAYRILVGDPPGRAVTLRRIYEALTLLPGTDTEYTEAEFVRDVYTIDREGPRQTKSGATVNLLGSTGTKNKREVLAFIGPEGELVEYFGIQFSERAL